MRMNLAGHAKIKLAKVKWDFLFLSISARLASDGLV